MNEIISELEKTYIYLDKKRKKHESTNPETARIYKNALNDIWIGLNYEIVKEIREGKNET